MKFLFALMLVLPCLISAEYTKFQWSDCGSRVVQFYNIDITPMPILQPGTATLDLKINLRRNLNGKLKTTLNIVRSVSGVALPIRCYLASGVYVGSCTYDDICDIVATLLPESYNPSACPPSLLQYGIDCTCPFKLKAGNIEIPSQVLSLPDASQTIATFLASGDFDIKIETGDQTGPVGCVSIKFSVKPASQGK